MHWHLYIVKSSFFSANISQHKNASNNCIEEMLIIKSQGNLSTKSIFYYLADAVMNINHRNLHIVEA